MEEHEHSDFIEVLFKRLEKIRYLEFENITIKTGLGSRNYLKANSQVCMFIREDDSMPNHRKRIPLTMENLLEMEEQELIDIWSEIFYH